MKIVQMLSKMEKSKKVIWFKDWIQFIKFIQTNLNLYLLPSIIHIRSIDLIDLLNINYIKLMAYSWSNLILKLGYSSGCLDYCANNDKD